MSNAQVQRQAERAALGPSIGTCCWSAIQPFLTAKATENTSASRTKIPNTQPTSRTFGIDQGKIIVPPEFFDPLEETLQYFSGVRG